MSQMNRYFLDSIESLTGDVGGPVQPDINANTSIVGDGFIIVTGDPLGHTLTISNDRNLVYTNIDSTPYVVFLQQEFLSVDTSTLAITVQLPDVPVLGKVFVIKDRIGDAATRNITVTTVTGATLIDGAATFVMNTAFQSIQLIGNGLSYEVF